jgi:hypothetical protein
LRAFDDIESVAAMLRLFFITVVEDWVEISLEIGICATDLIEKEKDTTSGVT